ncbi:hypothetical protein JM79_3221 [Gramella sp. Hel_I_59]|uniref:hypothetical protein n=1 Tax=Gramella sp. Hel_I_59 TaxID=1249978 RepID=UPI00114DDC71|nr:hypothetical protein [Gramella sp. Hel_I_59]TQI72264.1 hypothetical protein JM79_3221 [Gramella sp. Hel_I_59]
MRLISFLKNLFTSTNDFFMQDDHLIFQAKRDMDVMLQLWQYEISERGPYNQAFDYFLRNPKHFNGASMTEELCDIPWLDLDAMLHDYLYVGLNASASLKMTWRADKLLRQEMRRRGKSSWNTGYRFAMLTLKTPFFLAWAYLVKGRRISDSQKRDLKIIFALLEKEDSRKWHEKYKGEITWAIIIIAFISGYLYRTDFLNQLLPW